MEVVTAAQMQSIDGRAIEELGIPGIVLMERAGLKAFDWILHFIEEEQWAHPIITILAGKGNNGGDGLVVARLLAHNGYEVKVLLLGKIEDLKGEAGVNGRILEKLEIEVIEITSREEISYQLKSSTLIIDALLGTGLKGEVSGLYAEAIEAINHSTSPVISLDIPSGLDSDRGVIWGCAVEASMTITFARPKLGHLLYPGASLVGDLKIVDIGIPYEAVEEEGVRRHLLLAEDLQPFIPIHGADSHKGRCGHLLLLAGSTGMTGAATLAAQSALRGGCGLLTLGIPKSLNSIMEIKLTEAMTRPLEEKREGVLGGCSFDGLYDLIPEVQGIALGPGLGQDPSTGDFVEKILDLSLPLVIDADGLNLLEDLSILQKREAPTILTPHPGELARLLSLSIEEVQRERVMITEKSAEEHQVILVLKGAPTIISDGERTYVNTTGNKGMATAGSGDVLTGLIASLLVQGAEPSIAASLGVYLHGVAGDFASQALGTHSLVAGDLIDYLSDAFYYVQQGGDIHASQRHYDQRGCDC